MKKGPWDAITIHMYASWDMEYDRLEFLSFRTKNENHMIYVSWDVDHNREFFSHFGPFFAFDPSSNPETQNFEKMLIYYHFTYVYHKGKSYDVCFLKQGAQQT